ncbi:hypothetical protein BCIN_14g03560 [Botrytis cinerea B05.10]|uniref:2EXR domain-containing protein n=1 Tax=Botryotinia fuckeliana (strain B05.10) TaxID=332648 RepID=A0A384K2Y6_BOTFB|nr:hypothetical protein BCIN_14g03560 [Botrytis cinerea B05.10]XP_024552993.1 hypothetical protein BCIN_14g03560 [Botrytis cinerea B05.10]XP_024552994.1 hypothetical protein BCIN_14g03560 [Botrytis cinerea B05.10]ATZ57194.1 hypothetical protein BCIN_14g03560 [Botrytis cinerea B05.10]ATZ57195.1 hypothetical protein BCIN_14g03560 [Botrytis cinerea B05.10]ATZ57196.1 hypothetical protein BCIN_14g03560 [Botrytis cinerea B05.10]
MAPVSTHVLSDRSETTFHPFPRLPLEIRRLIWRAALPGPRNVVLKRFRLKHPEYPTVQPQFSSRLNLFRHGGRSVVGLAPVNSNPAIFYTCRESLEVASETYTLTFGSLGVKPRTWFDYNIDSLHVDVTFLLPRAFCSEYLLSRLKFWPRSFISRPEISGLDNVVDMVYVVPGADGIYRPILS